MKSVDRQSWHHPEQYDNSNNGDEIPFSNYIMSVKLLKGFKPPTDMEPYDESTDPQEYMGVFKSRMALVGAYDPVRCRAF